MVSQLLQVVTCMTGITLPRYEQFYALPIGRKKNQQRREVSLTHQIDSTRDASALLLCLLIFKPG